MIQPITLEQKISAIHEAAGLPEVPLVIKNNLNPVLELRPYQAEAFSRLVYLLNNPKLRQRPTQLLFQMATGSGKTLIIAGTILYLYSLGYRDFLFFVNSTNILNKTKDNFLSTQSIKYLFNKVISVENRNVVIREVYNLQHGNTDDINIIFTTIQGLHSQLNTPKENGITYEDFNDRKVVLISDEAHHINVDTKNRKRPSTEESDSWESTVDCLYRQNVNNILLEFTATSGIEIDENIKAKYFDKRIFEYPLRKFREDGYSKEVKVLQADLRAIDRGLQAILLSQYRRKIFQKNKLTIKPVLMFKSKTISESKEFYEEFCYKIKNLTVFDIQIFNNTDTQVIAKLFKYLKQNEIAMEDFVLEIKNDFSEDKCIVVNSQEESESKQIAINTLEDARNEYRAIFAVDKLNEGWDVLNLFDIVRLYETRDAKDGKPGNTTIKEAQLIGRGARYCPFQISSEQSRYRRKYDNDIENDLRICEELYYHSSYNPKYISELNVALRDIGIKARETMELHLQLKNEFKETDFYKNGAIYLNQRDRYDRSQIKSLPTTIVAQIHKIKLRTGHLETDALMTDMQTNQYETTQKEYLLVDFGKHILMKALHKLCFYDFNNLQSCLPIIQSYEHFITDKNFLGNVKIEVDGDADQVHNLTTQQKLDIAVQVLDKISKTIISEKIEYVGTYSFSRKAVKECFKDKKIEVSIRDTHQEIGIGQKETTRLDLRLDLSKKDWYVFMENFGTSQEKALVKFINKKHDVLRQKFDKVYLLRNEKFFQLYNFSDGAALEPDFVLYLEGKDAKQRVHYQIFIEPKGEHLFVQDKWKEDFLKSLKNNAKITPEVLMQNTEYKMWGLPFYNSSIERTFDEEIEEVIKGPTSIT